MHLTLYPANGSEGKGIWPDFKRNEIRKKEIKPADPMSYNGRVSTMRTGCYSQLPVGSLQVTIPRGTILAIFDSGIAPFAERVAVAEPERRRAT